MEPRACSPESISSFAWLQILQADGGYASALVAWVKARRPFGRLNLEIVPQSGDAQGFKLVRKRWIVERTLAGFTCAAA